MIKTAMPQIMSVIGFTTGGIALSVIDIPIYILLAGLGITILINAEIIEKTDKFKIWSYFYGSIIIGWIATSLILEVKPEWNTTGWKLAIMLMSVALGYGLVVYIIRFFLKGKILGTIIADVLRKALGAGSADKTKENGDE